MGLRGPLIAHCGGERRGGDYQDLRRGGKDTSPVNFGQGIIVMRNITVIHSPFTAYLLLYFYYYVLGMSRHTTIIRPSLSLLAFSLVLPLFQPSMNNGSTGGSDSLDRSPLSRTSMGARVRRGGSSRDEALEESGPSLIDLISCSSFRRLRLD